MPRITNKEKDPKGGWLGPPSFSAEYRLTARATAEGNKGKGFKWKENKLTDKELKRHDKFQKRQKQMDKEGLW